MNCNLAFDLMTDSEGRQSRALQAHLDNCPRCRQMQETLAPALEWMLKSSAVEREGAPQALRHDEREPRGREFVSGEALRLALDSASSLESRTLSRRARIEHWALIGARYAAAVLFGGLLALTLAPELRTQGEQSCKRYEAAAARRDALSAAEVQSLVVSCTSCHKQEVEPPVGSRLGAAVDSASDWLLAGDRLAPWIEITRTRS